MSVAEQRVQLDALIIGGGIAGLWTLDVLTRAGCSAVVIERDALGAGQTIWSQGIIHGGLKYTLSGLMNPSAEAIREMPRVWRACLSGGGGRGPDLSSAGVRAEHCHLWQTGSIASRVGMIGARVGLRVAPVVLEAERRPAVLRNCPGVVARLDEQVIDPGAVLRAIAEQHEGRVVRGEVEGIVRAGDGVEVMVRGIGTDRSEQRSVARVAARFIVLCAGNGNAGLRRMAGLDVERVQVRPLRMVMVRGDGLPELNGHCVDGAKTRVTITTARDSSGRVVWQVGGDLAERGVSMSEGELVRFAREELFAALPGVGLGGCEWGTYDAPRAEAAMPGARRPDDAVVLEDGPMLTAFPTKLALAPRVAEIVAGLVGGSPGGRCGAMFDGWERPGVARGPWETAAWSVLE